MVTLFACIYIGIAVLAGMGMYIYDRVQHSFGNYYYEGDSGVYVMMSIVWPLTLIVLIACGICKFLKYIADGIADFIIVKREVKNKLRRMNDENQKK